MRVSNLTVGDLVLVRVKGRSIYGEVEQVTDGIVHFRPLCPAAGWRHASAREVIGHWRKTGQRSDRDDDDTNAAAAIPKEQLSLKVWT